VFKAKLSEQLVKSCDSITDAPSKLACTEMFSVDNFPLLMDNVAKAVGVTVDDICKGIGSC
jgi:hypothetical protein